MSQGGGSGLVVCTVFKTAGRRQWWLRWVRFPHAPATRNDKRATRSVQHWPPAPLFPVSRFPFLVVLGMILVPTCLPAQLPFPTPPPQRVDPTGADTIKVPAFRVPPPVPPLAAM